MELMGKNLCDFCFEPIAPGTVCPKCGLSRNNYHAEAGLLMPGANLHGKYIIGRVLGRGGFGATYLAYSSERNEVVAVKEYYPTGIANRAKGEEKISIVSDDKRKVFEKGAKRFFEEAQTMSRFNTNKNVVSVYEFFYANDTVYYSMEYLEGIDLKGYIAKKGGRLTESEAVTIMRSICDALVVVHSTQTLHRDISPDNIFVCTNGDVKLIDFGAAKQVIGDAQQVYSVVVKQGFAPAEQYKTNGKQGVWTDIYAVGASIYYAVTGKIPADAMDRVENPEIIFDSSLNLSPQFISIIRKCLQSRIEDRYQSAMELLGALSELSTRDVEIGGNDYVQSVYNGVSSGLQGDAVAFSGNNTGGNSAVQERPAQDPFAQPVQGYNPYATHYPDSQIPPQNMTSYPNSGGYTQYSQSGYPPSQYQVEKYAESKEKSGMMKGLIIGISSLVIVGLIIAIIVMLTKAPQSMDPAMQGMGPGQPPPPGQPMPPAMQQATNSNTGLIIGCGAAIVVMIIVIISTAIHYRKK